MATCSRVGSRPHRCVHECVCVRAIAHARRPPQHALAYELADGVSSAEAAADELDLGKAEALLDEKLAPLQRKLQVDLDKVSHHE